MEESVGGEDVATGGVDSGPFTPWLVCGPCCWTCGGGLRIILGGDFSNVRIYCEIEEMLESVKQCKDQCEKTKFSLWCWLYNAHLFQLEIDF